ncbi:MAG: rod shape-determining protein MreC [Candidatus Moraniibacteriota bacterium]|jgi:rod shape-determining protein MreC
MQIVHKAKRKKRIFIYVAVAIVLIIINPFNIFNSIRNIIMIPATPILKIGFGPGSFVQDKTKMIFNIGSLYKENEQLNNQVIQLKSEVEFLSDIKNENEILRNSVNLLPKNNQELIGADVVLRDPVGGNQWIMINRGSEDGVRNGTAVIVNDNVFVGVIDEVDKNSSRVRLMTHPDSSVNVASSRTGSEAIARGRHGLSLTVEDIKKNDDVKNGDMFITSNIGNSFPRGLSVGNVQNITTSEDNLFQTASINPLVELDDLRFVFIIK